TSPAEGTEPHPASAPPSPARAVGSEPSPTTPSPAIAAPKPEVAEDRAEPAATNVESQHADTASHDAVARRIEAALDIVARGQRIEGYNKLKAIALAQPGRADAQRGWSLSAIRVKAWGEALRAARSWVELEPSAEARLHLAKMEKATVQGD